MSMYENSLPSLKDLAHDQDRQIMNCQRKTQLFITLLYNLITGDHDRSINLRIASETAKVAHEAKKDSKYLNENHCECDHVLSPCYIRL